MKRIRWAGGVVALVWFVAGPGAGSASAQTPAEVQQQIAQLRQEFEALKQQYGERLSALETSLAALQGAPAPASPTAPAGAAGQVPSAPSAQVPPGAEGAGGPTGALPVYGNAAAAS